MEPNDDPPKFPVRVGLLAALAILVAVMLSQTVSAQQSTSTFDELGNKVDCHYCAVYQPVGDAAVLTIEQARNEAAFYARCRRNLYPKWLFHRIRELEAKQ